MRRKKVILTKQAKKGKGGAAAVDRGKHAETRRTGTQATGLQISWQKKGRPLWGARKGSKAQWCFVEREGHEAQQPK